MIPNWSFMRKYVLQLLLLLTLLNVLNAQEKRDSNKVKVVGLPLFFYSPDTRFGLGAGGIATFRTPLSPQASSVTFSFAYTQRKQLLAWFPYQLYFGKGKYLTYGEVGWYRYQYQFFGIGNEYADDYLEKYTAQYPRVRFTFLRNLKKGHALGLRLALDDVKIVNYDSSGLLLQKSIIGWDGGRSAGAGLVWWRDTRDNRFYPGKGSYLETSLYLEDQFTGSDFQFSRASLDVGKFFTLGKKTILAVQAMGTFTLGSDVPFFNLAQLGGPRRLRGYFEGKYRDKHLLLTQAELRQEGWGRFGGVLFLGTGAVFGTPEESIKWRPNGGLGIRYQLDKKQKINLRADYGFGVKSQGFYLTFGESF